MREDPGTRTARLGGALVTDTCELANTHVASAFPYGLYTIPEVSMIGETEESAKKKGLDFETGRAMFKDNARGQIVGDVDGMVKLVFGQVSHGLGWLQARCDSAAKTVLAAGVARRVGRH